MKRSEQLLRNLQNDIDCAHIHKVGVPGKKR